MDITGTTHAEFLRNVLTGQIYPYNAEALKQSADLQVVRGRIERIKDESTGHVTNRIVISGNSTRGVTETSLREEARQYKDKVGKLEDDLRRVNDELAGAQDTIRELTMRLTGTVVVDQLEVKHEDASAFDTTTNLTPEPVTGQSSDIVVELGEETKLDELVVEAAVGPSLEDELLALAAGDKE